ncbi:FitA-like ribbon-helix-helix domain-containing protein [Saccharothrix sp. NRRL B-16314]|uniref:FitA-like ribbon-helix-helix domain-containing protein n=1 Tax=Saccharothrix sp. NRRL B-16314 TaxID=1463825 RepID=UPI000526B214|nr:hypothetical protein [Saccharothrix sp. NRRL B-16314]
MSERATKPVHIRDVPADVVATLQARANAEGISLTAYLRNMFIEMARQPTMTEIYQRSRLHGSTLDVGDYVRDVRKIREEGE